MDQYIQEIEHASKHTYENFKNDYTKLEVLEPRILENDLKNIIDKITLQASPSPVGTYKYAIIKYPGDIDMTEKILSPLPLQDFLKNMVFRLKTIIESIVLSENIFFIEFKAGEDHRFQFDAKSASDKQIINKINEWHSMGLISVRDQHEILKMFNEYHSSRDLKQKQMIKDDILQQIREFKMLRWTAGEVLSGKKKLRGETDISMSLYEALNMQVVTKLDSLIWYNNRYIELTNFFYFELIDPRTNKVTTISQPYANHIEALTADIKKYLGCEDNTTFDLLKALKRVFIKDATIYRRYPRVEIIDEMNELATIINDTPGALSQIKADFGALSSLIKVIPNFNMKNVSIMLNSIMKRINNNILDTEATGLFNKTKDHLFAIYAEYQMYTNKNDSMMADEKRKEYKEVLEKFTSEWTNILKTAINTCTRNLIKKNNLRISCDYFGIY